MNNSEIFGFLPFMVEDERSYSLKLAHTENYIISTIFICTAVWGTLMKIFIYYNLSVEGLSRRPINILILIDQVTDHINQMIGIAFGLITVRDFDLSNCLSARVSQKKHKRLIIQSTFVFFRC